MTELQRHGKTEPTRDNPLLRRIRRAYILQRSLLASLFCMQSMAIALGCALVLFALDWLTGFPAPVRVLCALGIAGWCFVARPMRRKRLSKRDAVAEAAYFEQLALGQKPTGFDAILVSAAEFTGKNNASGAGSSAELRGQVIDTAGGSGFSPYPLILHQPRRTFLPLIRLIAALLAYGIWAAVDAETLGIFFRRCCGAQVKYKTMTYVVETLSPDFTEQYKSVEIRVKAGGRLPQGGKLELRYPDAKPLVLELERDTEKTDEYAALVPEPAKSFRYAIRLGDFESDDYSMQVIPPPVITGTSSIRISAPAYTKRPERTVPLGPIESCEGANLAFTVCADRGLASCSIRLSDGREFTAAPGKDANTYHAEISDLPAGAVTYLVMLTDDHGIHNREQINFPLIVRPDKLPTVRVSRPEAGLYIANVSTLRYRVELTDDYGLDALAVDYQVRRDREGGDSEEAESTILRTGSMNLQTFSGETSADRSGTIDFKRMAMLPGDAALLTFRATDTKPDRKDESGKSDAIEIRMVTAEELRELLLQEQTGVHQQLSDITIDMKEQRQTLERLDKDSKRQTDKETEEKQNE